MLVILEGLDHAGKSTLLNLTKQWLSRHFATVPCLTIRKQYNADLYPINYTIASMYDWQAILDRLVLANPDVLFLADRSFLTQAAWQTALGEGEHAMTDEQRHMLDMYCKVCNDIQAIVVYCKSDQYELDDIVDSLDKRAAIASAYDAWLSKLNNVITIDADHTPICDELSTICNQILCLLKQNTLLTYQ